MYFVVVAPVTTESKRSRPTDSGETYCILDVGLDGEPPRKARPLTFHAAASLTPSMGIFFRVSFFFFFFFFFAIHISFPIQERARNVVVNSSLAQKLLTQESTARKFSGPSSKRRYATACDVMNVAVNERSDGPHENQIKTLERFLFLELLRREFRSHFTYQPPLCSLKKKKIIIKKKEYIQDIPQRKI
jgi:hypothetical protein